MAQNPVLERFEVVKAMNTLICMMNDEEAYLEWCYTVPDQATDDYLFDIADDEKDFSETVRDFFRIWKEYANEGGLYIGGKVYDANGLVVKS